MEKARREGREERERGKAERLIRQPLKRYKRYLLRKQEHREGRKEERRGKKG